MAASNTVQIIIDAVDKTRVAFGSAAAGLEKLKNDSTGVLGDLGAAAAIAALTAFGKSVLNSMDSLDEMAQKTGTSVQALSTLGEAAAHEGVPIEALQKGLTKLAQNMVSAATGSGTSAQAFARLGISVKNAAGQMRPTEDVLLDLSEQFKRMPDGAQKSALAIELFGKAGVDMIPFLNQGRDGIQALRDKYRELGLEIDGPTATAAANFNDSLHTLGASLKGIATQIITAALPAMQSLADSLLSIARHSQQIVPIIKTVGEVILLAMGSKALMAVGSLVTNMTKMLTLWRLLTIAGAAYGAVRVTELVTSLSDAKAEVERVTEATKKGAAETELLVRAANELNGQGALSLKTQLDLAALAAQKAKENVPAVATALTNIGQTATQAGQQIKAALQDEVKRAAETVKSLSDSYKQANTDISASLKERITAIDQTYKQQIDAAKNASTSEAQEIAATTLALINAEGQKLSAIKDASGQMQTAWDTTYQAAIDLATKAGEAEIQAARDAGTGIEQAERDTASKIDQINRDFQQQKLTAYEQIASAYRGTVDRLIAEEQRHLQAARSAEEARLNLKMSVEDRIRSLLQKGMDDATAHADRQKQIDEKQSAARQALAQGDYEKARKLSEESLSLIERNATEVTRTVEEGGKKTTEVVISQGRASKTAMDEMRESAGIADEALAKLAASHQQAGDAAGQGADAAKSALAGVTAEITTLREELAKQGQLTLEVNTEAAKKGVDDIKAYMDAAALTAKISANTEAAQDSVKSLQAKIEATEFTAKVAAANGLTPDSVAALKAETEKLELMAKVKADTTAVSEGIKALQDLAKNTGITVPAAADFSQAEQTLRQFQSDIRTTLEKPTSHTHTVDANTTRAETAIDRLQRDTSSTHTVYVRKVERDAAGGLVGAVQRFATGGQALADRAAAAYRRMSGRISGPATASPPCYRRANTSSKPAACAALAKPCLTASTPACYPLPSCPQPPLPPVAPYSQPCKAQKPKARATRSTSTCTSAARPCPCKAAAPPPPPWPPPCANSHADAP